ncbi:MAG TPA: CBS domain-containing protein [Candidatus Eisenbacteria bacterium]|nr:CBS domain-containing protein [Candidatus Eisenbacteria bacterium]
MNVEELMTRNVRTCGPEDRLSVAAQIMWERDCRCVPVIESANGAARVVGMLTDRDVCMAAYTQGRQLADITVRSVMAKEVRACRCTDSIDTAVRMLEENQVHRLPVLDQADHLIGLLSLADIAGEAAREHAQGRKDVTDAQIAEALEAITQPRQPGALATTAA